MLDRYAPLNGKESEADETTSYFDVTIQKNFGLISCTDDKGDFMRLFKADAEAVTRVTNKDLEKLSEVEGISGDRIDFRLPKGLTTEQDKSIKAKVLDCAEARGADNWGSFEEAAVMTLLQHYDISGPAALFISERASTETCSYKNVLGALEAAFKDEKSSKHGPDAFKDDPIGHARAIDVVKDKLNATGIPHVMPERRPSRQYSGIKYNAVVRDLGA